MQIININNIAELKTRKGSEGAAVEVLGYYTKGDGGGGNFYWDNTSSETDNGGTILSVSAVGVGRWKRIYSGAVNVKWFGAKGDGVTDDTQSIINSFLNSDSINFDKSIYICSQINIDKQISINGNGATLKAKSTGITTSLLNLNLTVYTSNLSINNLNLNLVNNPTKTALFLSNVANSRFDNMIIEYGNIGVNCDFTGAVKFYNIKCFNQTQSSITVNGDNGSETYFQDCDINVNNSGITLNKAFHYKRTTFGDFGGIYHRNTRVTRAAGTINFGYCLESTIENTACFAFFNNCVSDNINGSGAGFYIKNISDVSITNTYSANNAALGSIAIDSSRDVEISKSFIDNAAGGKCIAFYGINQRVNTSQNTFNQGTSYWFDPASTQTWLHYEDYNLGTTLTNSALKLISSKVEHSYTEPKRFVTSGGGGAVQSLDIYDVINNKSKYFRNDNSTLQIVNNAFNEVIFQLDDTGNVILNGQWNKGHIIMFGYHIWVDTTGKLRIKAGSPTSDTDGVIVGQQ